MEGPSFDIPRRLNRIKVVLVEKEMSILELARKTGLSRITLGSYCNNITQPNLEKLAIIALALGVHMDELIIDPTRTKEG